MKAFQVILYSFSFFLFSLNASAQDVTFEPISGDVIYGSVEREIYICVGELVNASYDSVLVTYHRFKREVSGDIVTSLCTDIYCYLTSIDTIQEMIPPRTEHKVEIRWGAGFNNIPLANWEGEAAWEILFGENNELLDTFESKFIFEYSTSTSDFENEELMVYPNPTHSFLELPTLNNEDIQIFNLEGRKVLDKKVEGRRLDLSALNPGLYFGFTQKNIRVKKFRFIKI